MKVKLIQGSLDRAESTYDAYYSFHYAIARTARDIGEFSSLSTRDDFRVYLENPTGETIDFICTSQGEIISIAFRQVIVTSTGTPQHQIIRDSEGGKIAFIAHPLLEHYDIKHIRATSHTFANGKADILVSLADEESVAWHPISKNAYVGVDEIMDVKSIFFIGTDLIDE